MPNHFPPGTFSPPCSGGSTGPTIIPCDEACFKAVAGATVIPVYTLNGTTMANWSGFQTFFNNMWNHWTGTVSGPSGCAWWVNRVDEWTDDLIGPPPLPPITNPYHIALKTAKIHFAQQMHIECGCPGPVPQITGGGSSQKLSSITNGTSQKLSSTTNGTTNGTYINPRIRTLVTGDKLISGFGFDISNIKAAGETRSFTVSGDKGAVFSLEIRNEDNYYYNFETNLFQTTATKLREKSIDNSRSYSVEVTFPKVSDADKYEFYLFAESNLNTKHINYSEVRFADNSIDINSSSGSDSNLVKKVLYQTLDVTLTLGGYSPKGTVTGTFGTKVITTSRDSGVNTTPFSFDITTGTSNTLAISKQPSSNDVMAFVTATPAAIPVDIEGEDVYPAVTQTDRVDGDFGAGTTHKIVMDSNVADKMVVGDRVTIATTALTDTVDGGTETSGNFKIVMDNNVATKMAVGDRVTVADAEVGSRAYKFLETNIVTVTRLDPDGDNAKEFEVDHRISVLDGTALKFTSKLNREVITVAALNPDSDNVKEFSMKDTNGNNANIGIVDNTVLSFSNQRNYRWTFDNIYTLAPGMKQLQSTYFTSQPTIKEYLTQTIVNEGEANEYKIDDVRVPALEPVGTATTPSTPVTTRNSTTNVETITQTGNVTFSEQALLTFGGGANATIFSYGPSGINRLTGYDIEFTNLAVTLTPISTTTTAASSNSKSVVIADRIGISDGISTVSGIGINPAVSGTDTVNGAISGAAKIVMDTVVANTMKVGDIVTGDGIPSTSTVTVEALNPDGDNTSEFSVSENVTVADGITLSFSNQVNPSPFVASGAGSVTGAGTIVLSAPQTLENGTTLNFPGVGSVATITGNIKVNRVGNENVVLRFDLDQFLTMR